MIKVQELATAGSLYISVMTEKDTLSFSEDHIQRLISTPSLFPTVKLSTTAQTQNESEKLIRLPKKLIRTELHGYFLLENLKAGTVPWGLQVKNVPVIFTKDPEYKKGFSCISTIETAQRLCHTQAEEV